MEHHLRDRSKKANEPPTVLKELAFDAVEIDELCISKKRNIWLWTAVSRYSRQILGFVIGGRGKKCLAKLWRIIPARYRRRLVYTDGYPIYAHFFPSWQHRLCEKRDGGTCSVEGVNNSLRHRCRFLVRRASGPRIGKTVVLSLALAVRGHNRACQKRLQKAPTKATLKGE